jgi:hypothetical protein
MELQKWEKALPDDFYGNADVLWIALDGKVETFLRSDEIHATVWGHVAWDIDERGYYNPAYCLVTCHGKIRHQVMRQLAKLFEDAIYYRDFDCM